MGGVGGREEEEEEEEVGLKQRSGAERIRDEKGEQHTCSLPPSLPPHAFRVIVSVTPTHTHTNMTLGANSK